MRTASALLGGFVAGMFALQATAASPASPAHPALDVRGNALCPSPAMVAEVLRPLLPSDAELPAGAWLEVNGPTVGSASGSSIEVEVRMVRPADHGVLASRGLTGLANCDDAARAAAVIAATWATRYRLSPSPPLSAPEVWTGPAGEGLVSSREPTKTRPTTLVWSVSHRWQQLHRQQEETK